MKKKQKNNFPQYGGVIIASFILFALSIIFFSFWHFLAALLAALLWVLVVWFQEEVYYDNYYCSYTEIKIGIKMTRLLGGFLFLLLSVIFQALGGFFWCFLIGMIVMVFFHMCRLPLSIMLFDNNPDEIKNFNKFKEFEKAIKDEDVWDLLFPYNWWYIAVLLLFICIGWIASPSQYKEEGSTRSRTERVEKSSTESSSTSYEEKNKRDEAQFYKATTIKVVTQVEDNNTVFYIATSKDTLRCTVGKGAVWLNPEGGDRIEYTYIEKDRQKQVQELVVKK